MKRYHFAVLLLSLCMMLCGCAEKKGETASIPAETDRNTSIKDEGATPKPEEKKVQEKEAKKEQKEDTTAMKQEDIPKEVSPREALRQFAKSSDSICDEKNNIVYTNVRYKITDMQYDEIPELIAIGISEESDSLQYVEVYAVINGVIETIFENHCGAMNGGFCYPVVYRGQPYLLAESISSSNGFQQYLYQYAGKGKKCEIIHSSCTEFWNSKGETHAEAKYIINNAYVSQEEYDAYRQEVENGHMNAKDFVERENL